MSGILICQAIKILNKFTEEERLEVMNQYCKSCGSDNPKCQCWNDE